MAIFLEKRRRLMKNIYRAFGITTVSIVFQACYGMPIDTGEDVGIQGTVISRYTNAPIQGIMVSVKGQPYHSRTDSSGNFHLFVPMQDSYSLKFEDTGTEEILYEPKKKPITLADTNMPLQVRLNRANVE